MEFYSNCFIEMVKAKLRDPSIKVMYLPAFLNEVPCPHWMWLDKDGEHDFGHSGRLLPWYKWFWHKGKIRTFHRGCYKGCISQMIEKKYYSKWGEVDGKNAVNIQWDINPEDDDGVELPNEITIPNDIEDKETISDYISDVTGFCHKGFELEE